MKKEEIIMHYKTILPCEQFVVTGTYALQRMGLVSDSNDIDIILVNPTDGAEEALKRLTNEYPAKTTPGSCGVMAIFMHEQTKIDVFKESKKIETLMVDGFEICTALLIFEAKRKMNRPKDWLQLAKIARSIFKQEDFYRYVDK
ncbi:MAG: hypothetical protein LBH60_00430 [Prevotellaceae bacterium]|jgi:hypothetical protein|nr:hypothetical protein [Prevotellaceae bacterium]